MGVDIILMPKYTFFKPGYADSDYEADGIHYKPGEVCGSGAYDFGRMLKPTYKVDEVHKKLVLSPHKPDDISQEQSKKKHDFYRKVYPDLCSQLFISPNGDYRLVVPWFPGETLYKYLVQFLKNSTA